jgi:hypothetical protein
MILNRNESIGQAQKEVPSSLPSERSFADFTPFIVTSGLNEETSDSLLSFLQGLYNISSRYWQPGDCLSIAATLTQTSSLANESFSHNVKTVVKHWKGQHFWLEINPGETLVIDPTGIPIHEKGFRLEDIHPYFGPINLAQGFPGTVYTNGEDL